MHRSYKNYNRKDSRTLSYKTPIKTSDKRKVLSHKPIPKEKLKLESKPPKVVGDTGRFDYQYRLNYEMGSLRSTEYLNFWYASSPIPNELYPHYKMISTENFVIKDCKYRCTCDQHNVDYKVPARINVSIICPHCGDNPHKLQDRMCQHCNSRCCDHSYCSVTEGTHFMIDEKCLACGMDNSSYGLTVKACR